MTSVRLGVSSAPASTPMGVFNQRFEALFPCTGALGSAMCFTPPLFLLVYLCANVGPWGLLAVALPAPFLPEYPSLWVWLCCHESRPPCLPISSLPTCLDECFFFIYLDVGLPWGWISCEFFCFLFLNCCWPVFGYSRRCSVSIYASILVFFLFHEYLYKYIYLSTKCHD